MLKIKENKLKIKTLKDLGFKFTLRRNLIGYKTFNEHYPPPPKWNIKKRSVLKESVNTNRNIECAEGINFGTENWVKFNCSNSPSWKLVVKKRDFDSICIPKYSCGKVRCGCCKLIKKKPVLRRDGNKKCKNCIMYKDTHYFCKNGWNDDKHDKGWANACRDYKRKFFRVKS